MNKCYHLRAAFKRDRHKKLCLLPDCMHATLYMQWHHRCLVPHHQKVLLWHGLQLHLSPISFHLVWVSLKASHDKNRLYFAKRNTVIQDMVKIQGELSLGDGSEGVAVMSHCSSAVMILCDYLDLHDGSGKSYLTYCFLSSCRNSFGFLLGRSDIWLMYCWFLFL